MSGWRMVKPLTWISYRTCVRVAVPGAFVILPAELRVHDQAPGHVPGGVQAARRLGVGFVLAEYLGPNETVPLIALA